MRKRFMTTIAAGMTGLAIVGYLTFFKNPTTPIHSPHNRIVNEQSGLSRNNTQYIFHPAKKPILQNRYARLEERTMKEGPTASGVSVVEEVQYIPETTPTNQEEAQASCIAVSPDASSVIQSGYWPNADTLFDSLAKKDGIDAVLRAIETHIGALSDTQKQILHEDLGRIVTHFSDETQTLEKTILSEIEFFPFPIRMQRAQRFMEEKGRLTAKLYGELDTCMGNRCTWVQWEAYVALSRKTSLFF